MFEFFLALFGGAYYGTKVLNEKVTEESYANRSQVWNARKSKWVSEHTNQGLERKLSMLISDPENRETVDNETRDAYAAIGVMVRYLTGSGRYVSEGYGRRTPNSDLRIMMARRGYLLYWDALTGAGFSKDGPCGDLSAYTVMDTVVLSWCSDEIRRVRGDFAPFTFFNSGIEGYGKKAKPFKAFGAVISCSFGNHICHMFHVGWDLDCLLSFDMVSFAANMSEIDNRLPQCDRLPENSG